MPWWGWLIVGLAAGACGGLVLAGMLAASAAADGGHARRGA